MRGARRARYRSGDTFRRVSRWRAEPLCGRRTPDRPECDERHFDALVEAAIVIRRVSALLVETHQQLGILCGYGATERPARQRVHDLLGTRSFRRGVGGLARKYLAAAGTIGGGLGTERGRRWSLCRAAERNCNRAGRRFRWCSACNAGSGRVRGPGLFGGRSRSRYGARL
jgi:hypothetical protein